MGTFTQPVTITNPETGASVTVDALVDTGATFTMLPAAELEALGLRPLRTVRVMLADGQSQEVLAGEARITVADHSATSPCLFGPPGSPPLLGAVTLEILLLAVDPVRQTLVPTNAWLA